jgi:general secretion pathway protein I
MRRGITLYEVVLALAIFAGSMAAISQTIMTGTRAALQSRLQSQAILLSESKMGEIIAGLVPPRSAGGSFAEPGLEGWTWNATVQPGPRAGIFSVEVTVARPSSGSGVDASFSLTRLVRDQLAFINSATQSAQADAAAKTTLQQQSQLTAPQQN